MLSKHRLRLPRPLLYCVSSVQSTRQACYCSILSSPNMHSPNSPLHTALRDFHNKPQASQFGQDTIMCALDDFTLNAWGCRRIGAIARTQARLKRKEWMQTQSEHFNSIHTIEIGCPYLWVSITQNNFLKLCSTSLDE